MGCSSEILLKQWGLGDCCSSVVCPAPLLNVTVVLGEAVAAGLSGNGTSSGQGDGAREVSLTPPPELQGLSPAPQLQATLPRERLKKEQVP